MEKKLTDQEMQFIGFISMMANTALYQMGKVAHPVSGKIEKDLPSAQMTIELLKLLDAKTKGNLTENEQKVMREYLTFLQMNYVEEIELEKKAGKGEGKGEEKDEEEKAEPPKPEAAPDEKKTQSSANDVVLNWEKHEKKSYGKPEEKK